MLFPLLVALQNALQGFLVRSSRTWSLNVAAAVGITFGLSAVVLGIKLGLAGALAAIGGMVCGQLVEACLLGVFICLHSKR